MQRHCYLPWIQNSRRVVLQSSLRHSGTLRNIEDEGSGSVKSSNADDLSNVENLTAEQVKETKPELLLAEATLDGTSYEGNYSTVNENADASDGDVSADQVATLAIHDKSPLESSSANDEASKIIDVHELLELNATKLLITNGESGSPESKSKATVDKKVKEIGSSVFANSSPHNSGRKGHDHSSQRV